MPKKCFRDLGPLEGWIGLSQREGRLEAGWGRRVAESSVLGLLSGRCL